MQSKVIARNTIPLCFLPNMKLLCYHRGDVIVMNEGLEERRIKIPIPLKERILGGSRFFSRLLRFGVRASEAIDDNHAIFNIGNKLYELDVKNGQFSKGWFCGTGIRPLIMTSVHNIDGFTDGVYFGGYLVNREKKAVNIYHRVGVDNWEVVYTFLEGTINHIHCVTADPYRKCLWVFTGDFDESAAIWKVTDNFQKVERIACNNQKYRGCVVYAIAEGLLYATDAPYADNYIYFLNPDTFETKTLFPLHGSCIYGCQWNEQYVFSSTVEGDGRKTDRISFFYNEKRRGTGIKDNFTHLYLGNIKDGFTEVYKEKKDCLSFLFQFAVFKFPYGQNKTDTLYYQPIATNMNDMCLMILKRNKL